MQLGIITTGYQPSELEVRGKYFPQEEDKIKCDLGLDVGILQKKTLTQGRFAQEFYQAWELVKRYAREKLHREATLVFTGDRRGRAILKCSLSEEKGSHEYCSGCHEYCSGCQEYRAQANHHNGTKKSTPKNPNLEIPERIEFRDRFDLPKRLHF